MWLSLEGIKHKIMSWNGDASPALLIEITEPISECLFLMVDAFKQADFCVSAYKACPLLEGMAGFV